MALNDRKIKKRRSRSSWTQTDQRRYNAEMRRQREAEAVAKTDRVVMLGRMTKEERDAFLADEAATKLREEEATEERKSEHKALRREKIEGLVDEARLAAGYLQTELAAAIAWREAHGRRDGDWLDDPVAAVTTGYGFGEEVRASVGIKLQVNLCLDCSNSMYHNGLAEVSTAVMRTLYLALDLAGKQLLPGSLVVNAWLWAQDEDGKGVCNLSEDVRWDHRESPRIEVTSDDPLGPMRRLPERYYDWTGQDTWLHPLLQALDEWETRSGDPGAYRLDLIISDGVLEHPTDARKGDIIQDRRNGNLQSVVLNFLPLEEWGDYRVPNRCVQYSADLDNIFALLRSVLGDWLVSML